MLTYFEVEPHSRFEVHSHESEQITRVLSGELLFDIQGAVRCIRAGEVIAVPSNGSPSVWADTLPVSVMDARSPVVRQYESKT